MGDTPDGPDGGPSRPGTLSLVAGAVVAALGVVVGGALLVTSDVGGLIGGAGDGDDLDVAVVGDSFADQAHRSFLELAGQEGITAEVYAYGGTSICGWEAELAELAERRPDQLVLSFAGNDLQDCINPTGEPRTPEEVAADYGRDLDDVMELFRPTTTDIYVVLPPPIRDAEFEANAEAMRDMYRMAASDRPRVRLIETEPQLGPDGAYHAALPCRDGEECGADGTVTLRQDDGIHLTPAGGRRYAQAILEGLSR